MDGTSPSADIAGATDRPTLALRVLASGSRGNCAVLTHRPPGSSRSRTALIDAGLSPLRTRRLLGEIGLRLDDVDDLLLTHLDRDHLHVGWARGLPRRTVVHLHPKHFGRASSIGLSNALPRAMSDAFTLRDSVSVRCVHLAHDALGVAAFRFDLAGRSLGYATDLGHAPVVLVEQLRGVDVLAIESNYCPEMQRRSDRPDFLKRRITGGSGHLSNEQAADAVRRIEPGEHVVLLHLSQECNTPELARRAHSGAGYELTIASQDAPTPWVQAQGRGRRAPSQGRRQLALF